MAAKKQTDELNNDPKNWKLRIFYFNKADKRAIVPSRNSSFGPTFNFASPKVIFYLIGVFAIILLMLILRNCIIVD